MDPYRDHIRTSSSKGPDHGHRFSSRRTQCPKCNSHRSFSAIVGYTDKGKCFRCGVFIPADDLQPQGVPAHEQIFVDWKVIHQTLEYFDSIGLDFQIDAHARLERAAIYEHLAGCSREQADQMAWITLGDRAHDGSFAELLHSLHAASPFAARLVEIARSATILNDCLIGWMRDGATIYWYRNINGDVVNGKRVYYEGFKRDKTKRLPHFVYSSDHGYGSCLFGEEQLSPDHMKHDLTCFPDDTIVYLVESEKTAVLGRYLLPNRIWLATGGASALTARKAEVLRGRFVQILFDDDDAGREGAIKAQITLDRLGIRAVIINAPEVLGLTMKGFDLADHFDRTTDTILKGL